MRRYIRHHGEQGQVIILFALAMVGVVAVVAIALDGGMLYWNQRRAQNAADAAVIAGTSMLVSEMQSSSFLCGITADRPILDQIVLYAGLNDVPNADAAQQVTAYYLTEDEAGNRIDLPNPTTGQPWQVGDTGAVPCAEIVGLHVRVRFPQRTFIAGVMGIPQTRATVDAYAVWDYRNWCTDFAVFGINTDRNKDVLSVIGAGTRITNGGLHSNGGLHLGGGGQSIYLEPGRPVEFDVNGDSQISYDKIEGGPDPDAEDLGITQVPSYPLPDDFFYRFEDFAPNGFIWNETVNAYGDTPVWNGSGTAYEGQYVFYYTGDIRTEDVKNPDGTLRDGLYVVEGSIDLNNLDNLGEGDRPWRATLVAREEIQVSGGINQLAFARGVFIYTESDNVSNGAVKLSGSDNSWSGLIVAPNGNVNMSAASNSDLAGMIVANAINLSGSDNSINHRPEYCPPNPPRILLVQ